MPKQLNPFDSPLDDIEHSFSLEDELELNLKLSRSKFGLDRSTALAAFQALNYLVGYCWRQEKQPLDDAIPLGAQSQRSSRMLATTNAVRISVQKSIQNRTIYLTY